MWIRTSSFLKQFYKRSALNCRFYASDLKKPESDPAVLFFTFDVQKLLKTLTRADSQKVHRIRKDGTAVETPKFKFMTNEQLAQAESQAKQKLNELLQMPPVVKAEEDTVKVIYKDPALEGFTESKHIFTDISFGISNKERIIVVRDPDGTLRHSSRSERHRMNQIYFPMRGRELHVPKMFYDPHFKDLLKRQEYEFILDRACIQFEPDDPEYHRITKEVYFCVNSEKSFVKLRSTRHFGPLAFHLAWEGNIDNLLADILQGERIEEAVSLIRLYHKIHPEAKSAKPIKNEDDLSLIKRYIELDSSESNSVRYALSTYEHLQQEKKEMEKNVKKAHGLVVDNDEPKMEK